MELSENILKNLKNKKIRFESLTAEYFIEFKYGSSQIDAVNVLKLLNENICSFKQLVDKLKNIKDRRNNQCLCCLLESSFILSDLLQNNKLNTEDLKYLLNKIENMNELHYLCISTSLIKHILNEFVLDKEIVDKLNTILKRDLYCKEHGIHSIFDFIEYRNWNNLLKLTELNRKVYLLHNFDLNEDQKLELIEILKNTKISLNRLKYIVDNNLENTYDFDSLMSYLIKPEKKTSINI